MNIFVCSGNLSNADVLYVSDYGIFQSDMYSIGLILFELYQPFCTGMERSKTLMDIRKGIISPMFTERWSMLVNILL